MRLGIVAYSDYKSPYAYLAKNPTRALAIELPVDITWLPYTLRIAEYLDPVESRSPHNWRKVRYMYMDARRLANPQGLVVLAPQRLFNGSLASIGMLFAQRHAFFDRYHDLTFERFWHRELDIDSIDEMKRHIETLGGSPALFEQYALGAGADEHRRIVEEAEAAGVFGVPMYRFEDELFWGGDRLPLLRQRIEARLAQPPRGRSDRGR
jgi:2-hydroxychromene-2-carboxylate isomerase